MVSLPRPSVKEAGLRFMMEPPIATVKASLVALYFMHLRYDHPFNGLVLVAGLGFLALFIGIVLLDSTQYQPTITNW